MTSPARILGTVSRNKASIKAARSADPDRLSFGRTLAWSSAPFSYAANVLMLGYVSIYATDTLRLSAGLVGTVLLVSKIVDAVGVLLSGWIVDRSPTTRWGKARPYDLTIAGIWGTTALLFSTPGNWGTAGKAAWLMVSYLLVTALFSPLFNGSHLLYMARAFNTRIAYARASTRSGLVSGVGALVIAITFPILLQQVGKSQAGWTHVVLLYAVPLGLIGTIRFFTVPEQYETESKGTVKVSLRDILVVLRTNRWLWLLAGIMFITAIAGSTNVGSYYFRYVVGNLGLQGALAPLALLVLPVMLVLPRLIKRFSVSQLIMAAGLIAAAGYLINFFAHGNIIVLAVAGLLTNLGAVPVSFLIPILLLDTSTYNQLLGHRRLESVNGAIAGFAQNVGGGIAVGATGLALGMAGYDGSLSHQGTSATFAIVAMFSLFPAILSLVVIALARTYLPFERRTPEIRAELDSRESAEHAERPVEHDQPSDRSQ